MSENDICTYQMLRLILKFYEKSRQAVNSGVPLSDILSLDVREDLARIKIIRADEFDEMSVKINEKIDKEFGQLVKEYRGDTSP